MALLLAQALVSVAAKQGPQAREQQVTAEDLRLLEALLHEFEEEMASLRVRVEVARETLDRLAQDAGRVRFSGDATFRYELSRAALNNPGVGPVLPASSQPLLPAVSSRLRLTMDGGVTDTVRVKLRLETFNRVGWTVGVWGGTPPTGHLNSMFFPWNSGALPGLFGLLSLRWTQASSPPFEVQVGRLGGESWVPHQGDPLVPLSQSPTRPEALQFGPIGLLFSTAKDATGERTLRTYAVDGLAVTYGDSRLRTQGVLLDVEDLQGAYGSEAFYGVRVESALSPDVVLGLNVVADTCTGSGAVDNSALVAALTSLGAGQGLARCSFVWWGAQNGWTAALNTGSTNPYTNVPGAGSSADVDARLSPDLRVQIEWGLWTDPTAQTTGVGWQAQAVIGSSPGQGPAVILGYQSFDPRFYPPLGGAEDPVVGFIYPGGFQDVFVIMTFPSILGWLVSAGYETGVSLGVGPQPGDVGFGGPAFSSAVCERCSPAGQHFSGWLGSASRLIGPDVTLNVYYYGWRFNEALQSSVYRVEVSYQF